MSEMLEVEVKRERTLNQKLNDLKMKEAHKEKREMKQLHKLALKQVINDNPDLQVLVNNEIDEIFEKDLLMNELGHLAHKKRKNKPKRNSCIDSNLFLGDLINPIDSDEC
jgi:hypothetical protein